LDARRELEVLEAVAQDQRITQRGLSARMGIALGLANIYLKRLVRKGFVKCVNVRSNRLRYLLTPRGVVEKTRLTYEFVEYSLRLYRDARSRVRGVLEPLVTQQPVRVAIYGTGEAAELSYLCLKERGVEPVAIFGPVAGSRLLGAPVHDVASHAAIPFDVMIVATFEEPASVLQVLDAHGIGRERLLPLRGDLESVVETA
jgi:DNA-binding MarR family transcriptional regulator